MKRYIHASDGSEMVNMLYDLTSDMWFEPIDRFSDVVYNADEIIHVVDFGNCVEFGTNNGQELLIYDEVNGRKHIKYSCSMTTIFGKLVITDVWDENGQVYECDYDAIYDELAKKNNFDGVKSSIQRRMAVKANNRPAPRRRAIKAFESGVDGYAVQVRDMGKGYIHLFVYDTEKEAMNAYEDLYSLRWDAVTDDEYDKRVQYAIEDAKDIISEIDWRRDIDKDNIYNYGDDGRIQIVNAVSIDLYLYW